MITFGDYQFEKGAKALYRATHRIRLRPRAADLLEIFLERPGQVFSQQELAKALWPNTTVEYDQQIRVAVLEIRRALEDNPDNPRYIETIPRRGYRFIAHVETNNSDTQKSQPFRAYGTLLPVWIVIAILVFIGATIVLLIGSSNMWDRNDSAAQTIIAVLPARSALENGESEYPTTGITHALIARLIQGAPENIAVIGRTSVSKYRNLDLPANQIGAELGADMLLEVTIGGSKGDIEADVTLVDSKTGRARWSMLTTGNLQSIEAAIVSGLLDKLDVGGIQSAAVKEPYLTVEPRAYEAYLTALQSASAGSNEARRKALERLEYALRIEPDFALAHIEYARNAYVLGADRATIDRSLQRALESDPNAPDAYYLRGTISFFKDWKFDAAERDLKRAIALRPGEPRYRMMYSAFLRTQRRFEEARRHANMAIQLDPLSEVVIGDLEFLYLGVGEYENAIRLCERALNIRIKSSGRDLDCLIIANYRLGKYGAAADRALEYLESEGADDGFIAKMRELSGRRRVEQVWLWKLNRRLKGLDGNPNGYFSVATAYAVLGRNSEALDALEESVRRREPAAIFIAQDPYLAVLHGESRFQSILREVGLPQFLSNQMSD